MRYSDHARARVKTSSANATAPKFFAEVAAATTASERAGALLLVGGNDPHDLVVRNVQNALRWDRLPSYWSHAAIVLDWPDGAKPDQVIGVEAALAPEEPRLQVPERNGVTRFRLSRYLDRSRYPNLGIVVGKLGDGLSARLRDSALNPNRNRLRYPLWEWLGAWHAYVHAPGEGRNPLALGAPLPAAAFCEYVYQSVGLDLTPGATDPNACPETLWTTALRWQQGTGPHLADIRVFALIKREEAPTRTPLPPLASEFAPRSRRLTSKK